jgi:hypothetical protein
MIDMTVVLAMLGRSRFDLNADLQGTHAEHQDDENLLLRTERKRQQLWYRDTHEYHVKKDIDCCMSPSKQVEVDAFASMLAIPIRPDVRHRRAVKDGDQRERDAVRSNDTHQDVDDPSELPPGENSKAEAEKRQLDESNSQHVEDFADPQNLCHVSDASCTKTRSATLMIRVI